MGDDRDFDSEPQTNTDHLIWRIERLVDRFTERYENVPDEILEQRWRRREQIKDVMGAMLPFLILGLVLLIISLIASAF